MNKSKMTNYACTIKFKYYIKLCTLTITLKKNDNQILIGKTYTVKPV